MIKLLANENFPLQSVRIFQNSGYDIKAIGLDNQGITDNEVMDIAINEHRTILTFDRDYGELIFRYGYKPKNGVIYLRWNNFTPDEPAIFLLDLFQNEALDFKKSLTVIDRNSIRQRKY